MFVILTGESGWEEIEKLLPEWFVHSFVLTSKQRGKIR